MKFDGVSVKMPDSTGLDVREARGVMTAGGTQVRELAQDTVRTGIGLARHILRYLTYQMSR